MKQKIIGLLWGIVACIIISMFVGCKSVKYIPVETVRTNTQYKTNTVHDTIIDSVFMHNDVYKHDSVITYLRGDTIFVDRWHTIIQTTLDKGRKLHSNVVHDTIYINKTDSVQVPVPAERQLTKWEEALQDIGAATLTVILLSVIAAVLLVLIRQHTTKKHSHDNDQQDDTSVQQ